jgi:hypothetical protein
MDTFEAIKNYQVLSGTALDSHDNDVMLQFASSIDNKNLGYVDLIDDTLKTFKKGENELFLLARCMLSTFNTLDLFNSTFATIESRNETRASLLIKKVQQVAKKDRFNNLLPLIERENLGFIIEKNRKSNTFFLNTKKAKKEVNFFDDTIVESVDESATTDALKIANHVAEKQADLIESLERKNDTLINHAMALEKTVLQLQNATTENVKLQNQLTLANDLLATLARDNVAIESAIAFLTVANVESRNSNILDSKQYKQAQNASKKAQKAFIKANKA